MRILLTETDHGAGSTTERTLEAAGHEVVRCIEADATSFPCRGLADDACPLDEQVQVAVAVRGEPHPLPTARETGVVCALRHRLPLVVALAEGAHAEAFGAWARDAVAEDDAPGLLAAVTEAGGGDLPGHSRVATREAQERLGEDRAHAACRRLPEGLAVTVRTRGRLGARESETLAVQVAAAVRRHDAWAGTIDVAVLQDEVPEPS